VSRAPVPVGTRVRRSNGRWQVKVAPGGWKWEPRPSRKREGRVVAFEVSHEEWARLEKVAGALGIGSVAAFARYDSLRRLVYWEGLHGLHVDQTPTHAREEYQ